jgi:hypothetical protein
MDSFSNYRREEPFDPFAVMLFKALQVVAFLFFIALLVMNPEAKTGKIDSKAEFIISVLWPDNHPDDVDLYVEDPVGNIVWYHQRESGFMVLERDDRGGANNFIMVGGKKIVNPIREETVSIRGIVAGEYSQRARLTPWCETIRHPRTVPHCNVVEISTANLSQSDAAFDRCDCIERLSNDWGSPPR